MAKFTCSTIVHLPNGKSISFGEGDTVPGWALPHIGAHVHDGVDVPNVATESHADEVASEQAALIIAKAENDAAGIVARAEAEAREIVANAQSAATEIKPGTEQAGDEKPEGDEVDETEGVTDAQASSEPDFTQPAPAKAQAKRGRPRKQA